MGKRKRIGLNYRIGYDFSAGIVLYMQNLVKGLNLLPDEKKPELIAICSNDSPLEELKRINYPFLKTYEYQPLKKNILIRLINKASRTFFRFNIIRKYSFPKTDILYPWFDSDETKFIKHKYHWKPDFQEMYYPQHVSKAELSYVKEYMRQIASDPNALLVLSSEDAFRDFEKFFSPYKNKVKILRFISFIPETIKSTKAPLEKYRINMPYFMVSNQFWPHKNHLLVLKAIRKLKDEFSDFTVVFSGKQSSYRDENYFQNLNTYIKENKLEELVIFTGFIPRDEQLALMNNAIAVIQPSLFEGWSTVIEDCKALSQYVIASDLTVNQEQVSENCSFFDRHNEDALANEMKKVLRGNFMRKETDYSLNIKRFIKDLSEIFS